MFSCMPPLVVWPLRRLLTWLLPVSLLAISASAATINIGDIALITVNPPSTSQAGTVGFLISDDTGDPAKGGSALPPDFPVFTSIVLQNLTLTYSIGGNSHSFALANVGPGTLSPPPGQQFPSTTFFDSATLTGSVNTSTLKLSDNSLWQVSSPAFAATLLPSNGTHVNADTDLVLITVNAQPVSTPEPATTSLVFGASALLIYVGRRTRTKKRSAR